MPDSWLLRMVRLVAAGMALLFMQAILDVRIAACAAAIVWVFFVVSKVVSSFSAGFTSLVIRRCGIYCAW